MTKRNLYVGAGVAALALGLGVGSSVLGKRATVQAAGVTAPKFEVDPLWPKPLPNHWIIGQTIGLDVDSHDNVWIIHRPGTFDSSGKETYAMWSPKAGECCVAAPDGAGINPAGDLIGHWGRAEAEGHDWPSSNHGITVDKDDNVWLGANGAAQNGHRRYPAACTRRTRRRRTRSSCRRRTGRCQRQRTLSRQLHFEIHERREVPRRDRRGNASKGSMDTESVRGVAEIRFNDDGELIAADGYGNKRNRSGIPRP